MSVRIEYPRSIPARRPGDFKPAAPKFQVQWDAPVVTVVSDYLALQRDVKDMQGEQDFFSRVRDAFEREWGPDSFEEMRGIDERGAVNSVVVGYWTDLTRYSLWKCHDPFNAWFSHSNRASEGVGYWRETLIVPVERFETIFSESIYRAGIACTKNSRLEPMFTAGYFGAMRDRIAISAIDPLSSPYGNIAPAASFKGGPGQRVRIDVPTNLVSIRTGQFWQNAKDDQLDDYVTNLQPKLDSGVKYLQDNSEGTGCVSLRSLVNLDRQGNELMETSKHGYFLSLAHLEDWAASHKSHLDIFQHALAMRRKYGAARSVVTWHEVFAIGTTPSFEYINCHADTGLLRFANDWGAIVSPMVV
ncbi:phenylacetaldoxime dehydratase family protein [Cupriavidus sp. DF5525]|uniref:phenylacetaldoxime dehydratase family protein n=1 Tax=Cupriavidus sp. DF5525 TaxID=3160989 RepID=UPI0003B007FD|nr:phenylacetaldoxime dehydratase [Ralstonia pickettii DTP0602]